MLQADHNKRNEGTLRDNLNDKIIDNLNNPKKDMKDRNIMKDNNIHNRMKDTNMNNNNQINKEGLVLI